MKGSQGFSGGGLFFALWFWPKEREAPSSVGEEGQKSKRKGGGGSSWLEEKI